MLITQFSQCLDCVVVVLFYLVRCSKRWYYRVRVELSTTIIAFRSSCYLCKQKSSVSRFQRLLILMEMAPFSNGRGKIRCIEASEGSWRLWSLIGRRDINIRASMSVIDTWDKPCRRLSLSPSFSFPSSFSFLSQPLTCQSLSSLLSLSISLLLSVARLLLFPALDFGLPRSFHYLPCLRRSNAYVMCSFHHFTQSNSHWVFWVPASARQLHSQRYLIIPWKQKFAACDICMLFGTLPHTHPHQRALGPSNVILFLSVQHFPSLSSLEWIVLSLDSVLILNGILCESQRKGQHTFDWSGYCSIVCIYEHIR